LPFDSSFSLIEFEHIKELDIAVREHRKANAGKYVRMQEKQLSEASFPIEFASSGEFRLALRFRNKAQPARMIMQIDQQPEILTILPHQKIFENMVISDRYFLKAGPHRVNIRLEKNGLLDLDCMMILPALNGYDFPLDVMTKVLPEMWQKPSRFEAESLPKQIGRNVEDANASNGQARIAETQVDDAGVLVFGPYQRVLQPGKYSAGFSIQAQSGDHDMNVGFLEVVSNIEHILAVRPLTGNDFSSTETYQEFVVDFEIPAQTPPRMHTLEFRVQWLGSTNVRVDYIDLHSEND